MEFCEIFITLWSNRALWNMNSLVLQFRHSWHILAYLIHWKLHQLTRANVKQNKRKYPQRKQENRSSRHGSHNDSIHKRLSAGPTPLWSSLIRFNPTWYENTSRVSGQSSWVENTMVYLRLCHCNNVTFKLKVLTTLTFSNMIELPVVLLTNITMLFTEILWCSSRSVDSWKQIKAPVYDHHQTVDLGPQIFLSVCR